MTVSTIIRIRSKTSIQPPMAIAIIISSLWLPMFNRIDEGFGLFVIMVLECIIVLIGLEYTVWVEVSVIMVLECCNIILVVVLIA